MNCDQTGHPANWRGCLAYKKYVDSKQKRNAKSAEVRITAQNNVNKALSFSYLTPGKSFANALKPQSLNKCSQKPHIVEQFLELATLFLDSEELTLEEEICRFLSQYSKMSKIEAKREFLRLLNKVRNTYEP